MSEHHPQSRFRPPYYDRPDRRSAARYASVGGVHADDGARQSVRREDSIVPGAVARLANRPLGRCQSHQGDQVDCAGRKKVGNVFQCVSMCLNVIMNTLTHIETHSRVFL